MIENTHNLMAGKLKDRWISGAGYELQMRDLVSKDKIYYSQGVIPRVSLYSSHACSHVCIWTSQTYIRTYAYK